MAGFYATPIHLVPWIARLLRVEGGDEIAVFDPCAGEGDAVVALVKALGAERTKVYACELERGRYEKLTHKKGRDVTYTDAEFLHGDAFQIIANKASKYGAKTGAQVGYFNPPYDHDPQFKRLEERWLRRFTATLADDGVLLFVVPYYALSASRETLATHYRELHCYRFPDGEFEAFKQVVLIARKTTAVFGADAAVLAQVDQWATDPSSMPVLTDSEAPVLTIAGADNGRAGFGEFVMAPLDVTALLAQHRPWHSSERGGRLVPITGILPEAGTLTRTYPLAMPPKPAHIAAGIAAGVFNGARISPDDPTSKLPALLVKGVFDREFVTTEIKTDKKGEKTGEVQVQQPKLVITALDLSTSTFVTLTSSAEVTGATEVSRMTTADLLASYGRALMTVMLSQCPVLHDPGRDGDAFELPTLARPLYRAQAEATRATVKLLGGPVCKDRRGKAAFVLGEIGSGKSSVALATAETIGAKRVLVMCPPHLLDSWRDQARAVVPWARTTVLSNVADVDAFIESDDINMVIGILSREAAKLGHAWSSVGPTCPSCGAEVPAGDLARTRARCDATGWVPRDDLGRLTKRLALRLLRVAPEHHIVGRLFSGRHHVRIRTAAKGAPAPHDPTLFEPLLSVDVESDDGNELRALALWAVGSDDRITEEVRRLFEASASMQSWEASRLRDRARWLMLLVSPSTAAPLAAELEAAYPETSSYWSGPGVWQRWAEHRDMLVEGHGVERLTVEEGRVLFKSTPKGSKEAGLEALSALAKLGKFVTTTPCGEFLYQAVPEPRRVALAPYLARKAPRLLDLLILDEGQELASQESAQSQAGHRLSGLGVPTLLLSGSIMGGYAESLFVNQHALDPLFRAEFRRDQRAEFVRRYGYLKQLVSEKDGSKSKVVAYGSHSDRIETTARTLGNAPGVLPLFVLRYLLRLAVTLHKTDLALDLPPRRDIVETIEPTKEQASTLSRLQAALVTAIKRDQFSVRAGQLWGQMSELPSYLDRCTVDTGTVEDGRYVVAYPDGEVVATARPNTARVLPKERWMLDKVRAELAEGRHVMVLAWHAKVLPRLARLIEAELGEKAPVLDAAKVAAAKRQSWIDREVIQKGRRVLVVNPVAVQTGLNNLVWFSSQVWMENPSVNAITFRQATGRIDRIGQTKETRIYFPVYRGTTQEKLHQLLLHKVGVSQAVDGLDAAAALEAAGVGETGFSSFSVGRQIYELLVGEAA